MFRRNFLIGTAATAAFGALPAHASTSASAERLVTRLIDEINTVISSGKSEAAMLRDFEQIFGRYSDTSYIAAYAMGNAARRANTAQKGQFSRAFQGYIARKYGRRFREFIGARLEVENTRRGRNGFEVSTTAFLRGSAPFNVTFHVSDRSGKELFYNLYIEGINMLLTERTEITAMLEARGGDINALVRDLRRL